MLDGYIFREFMIKYSVLLMVFIILFILNDVYRDINGFLEARSSVKVILLFLLNKLPGNIRFILPISMLLGSMWTLARFGKHLEIPALRASGVSLFRCGLTMFCVGLVVTFVNIYFNEYMVHTTERRAREIMNEVDKRQDAQEMLAYRSTDLQRHWLFDTFSNNGEQRNVTVKTFWNDAMVDNVIGTPGTPEFEAMVKRIFTAKWQEILSLPVERQRDALIKVLRGRKVDFFAKTAFYDSAKHMWVFRNGNFSSYDLNDETIYEASRGTITLHPDISYKEIVFLSKDVPETPFDIINAIKEKDDLPTADIYRLVQRNPDMAQRVKDIYMTIFYYRLAFPWSCFLAVFLGIPLATKNERTGSLIAIITAVAMIVVYIVVAQIFLVLGKAGALPPVLAGTLPTIGFIAFGIWRATVDKV
ncbi:MAG: LptF/LptG family permease [Victivallaceae bacterium]|nr:LptF/LptG family permease [Victivallaceae bacterium]